MQIPSGIKVSEVISQVFICNWYEVYKVYCVIEIYLSQNDAMITILWKEYFMKLIITVYNFKSSVRMAEW